MEGRERKKKRDNDINKRVKAPKNILKVQREIIQNHQYRVKPSLLTKHKLASKNTINCPGWGDVY
jgi:hypothetical protein